MSIAEEPELVAAVRLALVSGVGPLLRQRLLNRFGSPTAVLNAAPSDLRDVEGIGPKISKAISAAEMEVDAEGEIASCRANNIQILIDTEESYPRALREIHDPPGILFVQGEIRPADALAIAIVGSRHATHYGLAQAERLGASLSQAGLTIISGLARGIDAAAHRGALSVGGRTIAVLGSGLLNIYPPEHVELAREVIAHGALISESPPQAAPMSGAFPQRNRIISGMSLGIIVVEAAIRSGALITARHAMEQGRDVFAVPGRVDNRMSHGCHRLIRDGAKLTETAEDVLEELGPLVAKTTVESGREVHHPAELLLNDMEQKILDAISSEPTTIDRVIGVTGLPTPQVLATISVLEMRHLIQRVSGMRVIRR